MAFDSLSRGTRCWDRGDSRQDLVASTEDEAFLLPRVLVCPCVLGGMSRLGGVATCRVFCVQCKGQTACIGIKDRNAFLGTKFGLPVPVKVKQYRLLCCMGTKFGLPLQAAVFEGSSQLWPSTLSRGTGCGDRGNSRQDLLASTEDEAFLLPRVLVCPCVLGGMSRVGMPV